MRTDAATPELLELLHELFQIEELEAFSLGGGTSLALRFGHRMSADIDLFSLIRFDPESLLQSLRERFSNTEIFNRTKRSLSLAIRGIKVDLLHHAYTQLEPPASTGDIRFVSLSDIAAMKVNAVTNRGSKKDFSDLLLLHRNGVTLSTALDLYCQKYGQAGRFLAIRSLQFFDDAREEPDPLYLNDWTWDIVEGELTGLTRELSP
jgi:predicted nucleotidyltransferase component of viral defense system